jgi:chromosome segregation ATPase
MDKNKGDIEKGQDKLMENLSDVSKEITDIKVKDEELKMRMNKGERQAVEIEKGISEIKDEVKKINVILMIAAENGSEVKVIMKENTNLNKVIMTNQRTMMKEVDDMNGLLQNNAEVICERQAQMEEILSI